MDNQTHSNAGFREDLNAAGNQLVDTAKSLIAKGNVRSIVVRKDGRTIVELPLTVGVIGTLLAPQLALLGVLAAFISQTTIEIRSREEPHPPS